MPYCSDDVDSALSGWSEERRRQMIADAKATIRDIIPSLVDDKLRQCGVDPVSVSYSNVVKIAYHIY